LFWPALTSGSNRQLKPEYKELNMYARNDLETIGTVRSPVQCEGIERGPKRIAEVAASGSVNPQGWQDIFGGVLQAAPGVLGAFGI
jgi:hypothetical protein